jgi:uncharacterized spore protein YtfJ
MLEELIDKLLTRMREIVSSETVIGEPITAGEATVVPITKISLGFGAGGSQGDDAKGKGSGSGIGGGAVIEPVAVITILQGEVKIHYLKEKEAGLEKIADLIPKVLDRFVKPRAEAKTEPAASE